MMETVPSGTVLRGRYRIERVLGSGGFGHVYLSIDLKSNQQCAIKEYLVTGSTGQEQLQHEARVLSQLHHPNLPAFQDAFIESNRYYVVLNYIEGNDLTDLIRVARQRNEAISITQMLGWILAICDAVMFLHNQRPAVIHRDIKPDNIRITSDGTAVLVDLGNAKAAADGARTLFFIRHQGTPGYAPPEQYPGGAGTDARSDVYALGGTLYFALTAHEPPSVSTRNQSIQQGRPNLPTLQEHLANNPPEDTPEAIAARQFRLGVSKPAKPAPRHSRHIAQLGMLPPDILQQLNRIIQRSMGMKPNERYAYVADFANELKAVMSRLPQPPAPNPTRPRKDPNSTQPDLPGLYDALQAAKEQSQPQRVPQVPNPAQTQTQPMEQGANVTICPNCGSQSTIKSPYCPLCGSPLAGPPKAQQHTPYRQYNAQTADQTVIREQQYHASPTAVAQQPTPFYQSSPTQATQTGHTSSFAPNNTAYTQNQIQQGQHASAMSKKNTLQINPTLTILGIAILIGMIILVTMFIVK